MFSGELEVKEADTADEKVKQECILTWSPDWTWSYLQGVLEHELHHRVGTAICMPVPVSHWPMAAPGNGGGIKGDEGSISQER